jgi:hypothetical protein
MQGRRQRSGILQPLNHDVRCRLLVVGRLSTTQKLNWRESPRTMTSTLQVEKSRRKNLRYWVEEDQAPELVRT